MSLPAYLKKYRHYIGIDPGVETGIGIWDRPNHELLEVSSRPIHRAMEKVIFYSHAPGLFVRVEDARLRQWFGKSGPEKWKGAGSIMRDCKIWEEFLLDSKIPFEMVAPKLNKTKMRREAFERLTGWLKPTNEHGRDAAMLVYGH
jgi:hypothetical protein